MKLYVRELNQADIPFIHIIYEQNRGVLHGNPISTNEWNECLVENKDSHEINFIIMDDHISVAWLKMNCLHKSDIWISMLIVDHMYKHKGVGGFALKFAEEFAVSVQNDI